MNKLLVFVGDAKAPEIIKLARFLGLEAELTSEFPNQPRTMVLSGELYQRYAYRLSDTEHKVFVYNAGASELLRRDLLPMVEKTESIRFSKNQPAFSSYLTGLSFQQAGEEIVFQNGFSGIPIILADTYPMLIQWQGLYISASPTICDIDEFVPRLDEPQRSHFSSLIPLVLFLKWAFKEQCWHLPIRAACITIDDPTLQPSYGFIQFEHFQQWLKQKRLAATFAFIPWNHQRSDPQVIKLFKDNPYQLSICVHGCNHTEREFATTNRRELHKLAALALRRMENHRKRYGLNYEPIMIFPQGKFSAEAIDVIGKLGYRAAVSSGVYPTNYANDLRIRDVLDLAVQSKSGMPLFRRRYPEDIFDFACDMLFEKPVLIVQHHDDFRDGYAALENFIKHLQALEPTMVWMPLEALLEQSEWVRLNYERGYEYRQLYKRHVEAPAVRIPTTELHFTVKERFAVTLRRYLQEFRDEFVHKNAFLNRVMKRLREG